MKYRNISVSTRKFLFSRSLSIICYRVAGVELAASQVSTSQGSVSNFHYETLKQSTA